MSAEFVHTPIASFDDLPDGVWCGCCGMKLDGFHGDAFVEAPTAEYTFWGSVERSVAVVGHMASFVRIHTDYGFHHECTHLRNGSFGGEV